MIITKLSDLSRYTSVNPYFQELIDFLEKTDIYSCQEGRIDISGDKIWGNCFLYQADNEPGAFFETHQNYLDIHLVLENTEDMAVTTLENATVRQPYIPEQDIALYEGKIEQLVHLHKGDCLITFPEDLHQPKVRVNDSVVKKVVFKVALS